MEASPNSPNMYNSITETELDYIFTNQTETAFRLRKSTATERIEKLKKLNNWILAHQKDIRLALWEDFKKPQAEVDLSEIYPVTSEINHALKNLKSWMKPKKVATPLAMAGTSSKIYFEPKGRSLIISPWNFPFNLTIGPLVSCIAAGCTAVIKPSEHSPATSTLIKRMVTELFSDDEITVLLGGVDITTQLLDLPFDHIFFTGSPAVGKIVMKAASQHLSSVTLELGGKSPVIIDESADIKDAAGKIVWGKFVNCGQTCIAPDYILVHESKKEEFLLEAKHHIQKFYDPKFKGIKDSPDFARIINHNHFARLRRLLEDAIYKGVKVEFGGTHDASDRYLEPTLLSEISDEMDIAQEEIFGPLLPIITFREVEEAISLINSKPKPLALYIFGSEKERINQVLQETSSGNAVVNDCVLHFLHLEMPFGGVNNSGIGKAHGYHGFLAFSNEKGVLKQRIGFNNVTLLRPPYGIQAKKIISSLIKWL
jgi:aldehyde dehydrogenase (NAD+)